MDLLFALFDNFGVFALPFGLGQFSNHNFKSLEKDLYFAAGQWFPRDVEFEESKSAEFDVEGQIDFFNDFLFKCDVFEDDLTRPNSNGQVLFAEILDVLS